MSVMGGAENVVSSLSIALMATAPLHLGLMLSTEFMHRPGSAVDWWRVFADEYAVLLGVLAGLWLGIQLAFVLVGGRLALEGRVLGALGDEMVRRALTPVGVAAAAASVVVAALRLGRLLSR